MSFRRSARDTAPLRRGAALYITVLCTALIVSVLGLAGLTISRIERRQMSVGVDRRDGRLNARSAVELALRVIANDPNWRTTYTNGVETTPQSLGPSGSGTVSWVLEDSDGNLTDADTDLRLKGVGRVGNVLQVSSVKITVPVQVLDSLNCSVYALGNAIQSSNSTTNAGPFGSAAQMTVNGTVTGDVEGNPVVVVGTVTGTVTDPGPARAMPPASVWDTYAAMATTIPYTNFPATTDSNRREMGISLLGASINPYGLTNAEGVYYIQVPDGKQLTITKSRLHCTLLMELGVNATFNTSQSCLWDPAEGKNYPCAIVKSAGAATFELKSSTATLKEAQNAFNFNPFGEPYDGVWDSDKGDQYPPKMRGLFHIIGSQVQTTLAANLNMTGVVLSEGPVTLGANLTVTVDPNLFSNPPLGYTGAMGDAEAVPGSWQWDAAP